MLQNKFFWLSQNILILLIYACGGALLLQGQTGSIMVIVCAVILVAHVLEVPLAMHMLRDRDAAMGRLLTGTLLFGFTWWLPARKGVYAVR